MGRLHQACASYLLEAEHFAGRAGADYPFSFELQNAPKRLPGALQACTLFRSMTTPGSAEESLQLAEHYRYLTDEELIALARQRESLTEPAQHTLTTEMLSRRLKVPPLERKPSAGLPPPPIGDEHDPYREERELIEVRKVWSRADAQRLQRVLDVAGIPFYMGNEKATGVDEVASNFASGVAVKVMRIGLPWAYQAMESYFPKDEQPEPKYEDAGDVAIRCPRCRSTDAVFNKLINSDSDRNAHSKYHWTCASCGNEWRDDGVQTKA